MPEVIHLETKRELFVDYYLINDCNRTALQLHHPTSADIAIKYDQAWETDENGSGSFYTTVFKDKEVFKMYYRGHINNVCYAESKDGINWHKPDLGLFSKKGFENNNILMDHMKKFVNYRCNNPKLEKKIDKVLKHDHIWDSDKCLKYGLVDKIV